MNPLQIDHLIEQLYSKEIQLTKQKSSSHVLEKCLVKAGQDVQKHLIKNLIEKESDLVEMCCDRFANYVVQKVITICDDKTFKKLKRIIEDNYQQISQSLFSKHIIQLIRGDM